VVEKYNIPRNHELWKRTYNDIKDDTWGMCDKPEDFKNLPERIKTECETVFNFSDQIFIDNHYGTYFEDENGIKIVMLAAHVFDNNALLRNDNIFSLYNSNPKKAHQNCAFKVCHLFDKGKLYQCPMVAHLPDFYNQFYFDLSDEDKTILLNGYEALRVEHSEEERNHFLHNISNQILACKFCPEAGEEIKLINAGTNKIRIEKRK